MMVEWLFLVVIQGCLRFVIVVFPDHTHLLFLITDVEIFIFGYSGVPIWDDTPSYPRTSFNYCFLDFGQVVSSGYFVRFTDIN